MGMVAENIKEVEAKIAAAAKKSGREAKDILLLAVSKTKPVELIGEAVQAGLVSLGENKVHGFIFFHDLLHLIFPQRNTAGLYCFPDQLHGFCFADCQKQDILCLSAAFRRCRRDLRFYLSDIFSYTHVIAFFLF